MADILEQIIAHKRKELEEAVLIAPTDLLRRRCEEIDLSKRYSMSTSLSSSDTGIIAEFKRRSPSKGWIKEEGKADIIPPSYAENGASACSILTDRDYFGGDLSFIETARPLMSIPILRKEFIISQRQVYEAKLAGADAILLIAACLTIQEMRDLSLLAHDLGLEVLMEIHSEREMEYICDSIDMIGVNNRNLGSFVTDVRNSFELSRKLPSEFVRVSESGISNPDVVIELRDAGFRGFLIGECFMRQENPGLALKHFIESVKG